jgi:hypothetical protein
MTQTPAKVRLTFLGQTQITVGTHLVTPDAERLFALLTILGCDAGKPQLRDDLVTLLWGEADGDRGRHNLRQTVYKARQLGVPLQTIGEETVLPRALVWCDWEDGEIPLEGEWLSNYDGDFTPGWMSWIISRRRRIHSRLRPRVLAVMQSVRATGDVTLTEKWASKVLRLDPLNEEATLVAAECKALAGSKIDALKLLDAYIAEIEGQPSLVDAVLPAKILRTRIAERLPVAAYAAEDAESLPFVGREAEVKQLVAAVFDVRGGRGETLWIWGPEGIGKTRVIGEMARAAALQGVRVVRESSNADAGPTVGGLRRLVGRLIDLPGALGSPPDALRFLRGYACGEHVGEDVVAILTETLGELLAALGDEQPMIVTIDPADTWDRSSLCILAEASERNSKRHHALLLVTRTAPRWLLGGSARLCYRAIAVRPMSPTDLSALLRARETILGPTSAIVGSSLCADISEGNPRFALELLGQARNLADGDILPNVIRKAVSDSVRRLPEATRLVLCAVWAHGAPADLGYISRACGIGRQAADQSLDRLLEDRLVLQTDEGYRASAFIDMAHSEVLGNWLLPTFVRSCAEQLRRSFRRTRDGRQLLRAAFLLAMSEHQSMVESWLHADLPALLSSTPGPDIIEAIEAILAATSPSVPQEAIRGLLDEIRARVVGANRAELRGVTKKYARALPATPPEMGKFASISVRKADFLSAVERSENPLLCATDRVSSATHAIVLADNLARPDLVERALESLEQAAFTGEARSLDVIRGRMIANSAMSRPDGTLREARLLVEAAAEAPDLADACRAARNAAEALSNHRAYVEARTANTQARRLAALGNYAYQEAMCILATATLDLLEGRISDFEDSLVEASSFIKAHGLTHEVLMLDLERVQAFRDAFVGAWTEVGKRAKSLARHTQQTEGTKLLTQVRSLQYSALWCLGVDTVEQRLAECAADLCGYSPCEQADLAALVIESAGLTTPLPTSIERQMREYRASRDLQGLAQLRTSGLIRQHNMQIG